MHTGADIYYCTKQVKALEVNKKLKRAKRKKKVRFYEYYKTLQGKVFAIFSSLMLHHFPTEMMVINISGRFTPISDLL